MCLSGYYHQLTQLARFYRCICILQDLRHSVNFWTFHEPWASLLVVVRWSIAVEIEIIWLFPWLCFVLTQLQSHSTGINIRASLETTWGSFNSSSRFRVRSSCFPRAAKRWWQLGFFALLKSFFNVCFHKIWYDHFQDTLHRVFRYVLWWTDITARACWTYFYPRYICSRTP